VLLLLGWHKDNGNRSNQESKFAFLATCQSAVSGNWQCTTKKKNYLLQLTIRFTGFRTPSQLTWLHVEKRGLRELMVHMMAAGHQKQALLSSLSGAQEGTQEVEECHQLVQAQSDVRGQAIQVRESRHSGNDGTKELVDDNI